MILSAYVYPYKRIEDFEDLSFKIALPEPKIIKTGLVVCKRK
jgi:hypothetical protein